MPSLSEADRQELLGALIAQLQSDHSAALKAGNIGAAVASSRAIIDTLQLQAQKPEAGAPQTLIVSWADRSDLDRAKAMALLARKARDEETGVASGEGGVVEASSRPVEPDRELAKRLLALLSVEDAEPCD